MWGLGLFGDRNRKIEQDAGNWNHIDLEFYFYRELLNPTTATICDPISFCLF